MADGADLEIRPARSVNLTTAGRDVSPEDAKTSKLDQAEQERKDALVAEGIRRWKACADAEAPQREREDEDLKFARGEPEDQWPEELIKIFQGGMIDGKRVAARPCLTIPKLDAPINQTVNEARNARLSVRVKPKGSKSTKKGAQLRQEMIRAIEVDSNAQYARLWALERAAICGRGWYRIVKEYAADGDFEIDLVCKAIPNQGAVYCDPFAVEPDKADAEYLFITADLPKAEYKRKFDKSDLANADSTDELFTTTGDLPQDWIAEDHYRVAEYFYIEHTERVLIQAPPELGGKKGFADELLPPELQHAIPKGIKQRKVDDRKVRWCLMNAIEILEEEVWEGKTIPVIPVIGRQFNVSGKFSWKGIVSNAKDAQRSYNYGRSKQVAAVGLAPDAPWVVAEGQIKGYEDVWDHANTYGGNYMPYVPQSLDGSMVPPPQRNTVEPAIQAITLMVREADSDIKATTLRYDASLGNMNPNERSGKALKELKQQGELGSSHYLDNLASISMRREGLIYLEMLRPVYNQPGRIARLLGEEEDDEREVMLGDVPFVRDPDGRPMPAPPEIPEDDPAVERYELEEGGEYAVVVGVGKSTQTQREDNQQGMEALYAAAPVLAAQTADIYVEQMEGPLAERLAKRIRKMNPQLADEAEDGKKPEVDPAMQAKMQAQEQQIQQLTQSLQQTVEELKTNKAKVDAEMQAAQMESQAKAQAAQQEAQAKAQAAQAELASKERLEMLRLDAEREKATLLAQAARDKAEAEIAFEREKVTLQLASAEKIALMKMEHERAQQAFQIANPPPAPMGGAGA